MVNVFRKMDWAKIMRCFYKRRVPGAFLLTIGFAGMVAAQSLSDEFLNPPDSARPGVYWYFMDGNPARGEMVKDLNAMNDVGLGLLI